MKENPYSEDTFIPKNIISERNEQLIIAIQKSEIENTKLLIEAGVEINNTIAYNGNTPLTLACYYKNIGIIRLLIDAGSDVNKKNAEKRTCLQFVCETYKGNQKTLAEILKLLLENGANPNSFERDGFTDGAIHYAAMFGYFELVKLLVEYGADINATGDYGRTALIHAAFSSFGSEEIVNYLLENGADINAKNEDGNNALHELISIEKPNVRIAKLLIDKGIEIEAIDKYGATALHLAAFCGHKEIVEILIKNGADINKQKDFGETPIITAINRNHKDIVKLLFDYGAWTYPSSFFTIDLLKFAAENRDLKFAKRILKRAKTENLELSSDALLSAATVGDLEMTKYLVDEGFLPDADFQTNSKTPLLKAAHSGKFDVLKFLLEKGANIEAQDYNGNTALLLAASSGHIEIVEELLKQGADINEKNFNNWNALMQTCHKGNYELSKFLLEKGIDTDVVDKEKGATVLTLAKLKKAKKLVKLLKQYGAKEKQKKMRRKNEPYFSIFECDVCKYLLHKSDLASGYTPEEIEGLELIHSETYIADNGKMNTEMIKKCTNCSTFYHQTYSVEDDSFSVRGHSVDETLLRYNFERLKLVLENINAKNELNELEQRYPVLIKELEAKIQDKNIPENLLSHITESLTDYYINTNNWKGLKNKLLKHSNLHIVLQVADSLVNMFSINITDAKYPIYRGYKDSTKNIQSKLQIMLRMHKSEFLSCINVCQDSQESIIWRKYNALLKEINTGIL